MLPDTSSFAYFVFISLTHCTVYQDRSLLTRARSRSQILFIIISSMDFYAIDNRHSIWNANSLFRTHFEQQQKSHPPNWTRENKRLSFVAHAIDYHRTTFLLCVSYCVICIYDISWAQRHNIHYIRHLIYSCLQIAFDCSIPTETTGGNLTESTLNAILWFIDWIALHFCCTNTKREREREREAAK